MEWRKLTVPRDHLLRARDAAAWIIATPNGRFRPSQATGGRRAGDGAAEVLHVPVKG